MAEAGENVNIDDFIVFAFFVSGIDLLVPIMS